jgi:hypothetical protein
MKLHHVKYYTGLVSMDMPSAQTIRENTITNVVLQQDLCNEPRIIFTFKDVIQELCIILEAPEASHIIDMFEQAAVHLCMWEAWKPRGSEEINHFGSVLLKELVRERK